MEKTYYKVPAICWLKVTDYMHGWLQHELGGVRIKDQKIISLQHLPEAREVLRMETEKDLVGRCVIAGHALSASLHNVIEAGLSLDADVIERMYGVTQEQMSLYIPIECPKMCLTKNGVLRPWSNDVRFGKEQTAAMQRLIRKVFWKAVEDYDRQYAERLEGEYYPAVEMIEEFCQDTDTPDMYVPAIRREWQRRVKREGERS